MSNKSVSDFSPKTPSSRPRPTLVSGVKKNRKLPPETPAKSPVEFQEFRKKLIKYLEEVFEVDPKPIGSGHTSEVYIARHCISGIKYALKVAKAQPEHSRVLRKEYKMRSSLTSPYLIRYEALIFEDGSEKDPVVIVEEFASGGTLRVFLDSLVGSSTKMSEQNLKVLAKDILEGLFSLHDNKFLHMDIKPENIFIMENKRWKIGDFGKMIKFDELTGDSGMEGDANYMALELLQEKVILPVDGSLDMFSFGIILLEAACQYYPSPDEWRDIRTQGVPSQILNNAPYYFRSIIKGLLSSEPSVRPTARELINLPYFRDIPQEDGTQMDSATAAVKLILPPYMPYRNNPKLQSKDCSPFLSLASENFDKNRFIDFHRKKVQDNASLPKKLDFAL